jgi:pectin methylesterase-like acyl-CoA thioesterase
MKKTPLCGLFIVTLLVIVVPAALASTVVVGTCLQNYQIYSTISQAVSSVPSGSTVLVCPGVYAEQVTVTQPLTLRGVNSANTANPTIIVPARD